MKSSTSLLLACALAFYVCQKDDTTDTTTPQVSADLPAVYKKFTTDVQVY